MNRPINPNPKVKTGGQKLSREVKSTSRKKQLKENLPAPTYRQIFMLLAVEILSIAAIAFYSIVLVLGQTANWFSGTSVFGSLLPFAAGVLALIVGTSAFLIVWWKSRQYLKTRSPFLVPSAALALVWFAVLITGEDNFGQSLSYFRTLVGGKQEAGRVTLNHQVFAAYRRYNPANLNKMLLRAETYNAAIADAASEFDVDLNLLQGIAATESSFLPRDSFDGGHGLFQITSVPQKIIDEAKSHLGVERLSLNHPKHNAYIAAATFKHYLAEMKNDVFLGLLAYNIGPANGGLRFIMKKYGVTDFITIQPYLQLLPRDYPIRVLSYALAFRLWQKEGKLLAYEEGNNALRIQRIGIPGLP